MKKKNQMTDEEAFHGYQASIMAALSEYFRALDMHDVVMSIGDRKHHPRFDELLSVFNQVDKP